MKNIIIPAAVQICMDDVGWFNGSDDRKNGGSARTAMPRNHVAEDYTAIHELGRQLDMQINCGFILGEWDPDNRLRSVPYLSKFGSSWDNAAYLNREEMAKIAEIVRTSPYIDIAVHGLMHNYYKPGIPYSNSDYYYTEDGVLILTDESEIRCRLDAYFDILRYYNIGKTVNSFIPPNFLHRWGGISRILKDYGIKYISTPYYRSTDLPERVNNDRSAAVENGIITANRLNNGIAWYEVAYSLDEMAPIHGIFASHWPNVLHTDPAFHGEIVDNWVRYFKRCAEVYGLVLSKGMPFCATQSLYKDYAKVTESGGVTTIDLSAVPEAAGRLDRFWVSARTPIFKAEGCEVNLMETHEGFRNYEVIPKAKVMSIC